jgi:hypothetical protein
VWKQLGSLPLVPFTGVACLTAYTQPTPAPQYRSAPEYDAKGDLKRLVNFRTWVPD